MRTTVVTSWVAYYSIRRYLRADAVSLTESVNPGRSRAVLREHVGRVRDGPV